MAYGKKRHKRPSSKSKILRKRPSARNQKYQILDLSKRVASNARKLRDLQYPIFNLFSVSRQNLTALFNTNTLTDISVFQPTFQEQPFGALTPQIGKVHISKITVDYVISAGAEAEACNWTMFVVTPKSEKVAEEVQDGLGHLSNLVGGIDFCETNGITYMNKKRWHIHYYRKGVTRPLATMADSDLAPTPVRYVNDMKPATGKIHLKNPIKVNSRTGNWRDVTKQQMNYNQRYTMYVFNNNVTAAEGAPWLSFQGVVKGIQSQPYQN